MALKYYKNKETGELIKTLKNPPEPEDQWEEVIKEPGTKFMVCANPATGKSKVKDQDKILLERARNHSRDVDLDDTIAVNKDNEFGVKQNLLNEKGERRRKVDDL